MIGCYWFSKAENNLLYTNSREFTVIVSNQTSWKSIEVDVNLDVFISSKSSFTACIISLEVLDGNGCFSLLFAST